jgi:hypothetical protein
MGFGAVPVSGKTAVEGMNGSFSSVSVVNGRWHKAKRPEG